MTEDLSLPAGGLTVRVHPQRSGEPRVPRFPRGGWFLILLSLAPLIIAGLVLIVLLNEPFLFVIALAIVAVFTVVAVQYQKSVSRRRFSSNPEDWMSRTGFYVGPFDSAGLPGAAIFERQHGRHGHPPQVRLVMTNDGLSFGPAGHSGSPVLVAFSGMQVVDLIAGIHPRKVLITPPVATQRGQVVVTTTQGHIARFSGIPVAGIQAALEERGATLEIVQS